MNDSGGSIATPVVSRSPGPAVHYGHSDEAWAGYRSQLERLLLTYRPGAVLEVGGGANPTIPIAQVQATGLRYTVLDISADELAKAPPGYQTWCADIADPALPRTASFDFVFSQMVAEHVTDGERFHRNVLGLLRPGGIAFHFFPTLYTLPFLANRLMPERLADHALALLRPGRDRYQHAKFPAYYSWCRGPTAGQIRRLQTLGYEVLEYGGFYGHPGYYERVAALHWLHQRKTEWLIRYPNPWLTSFAQVLLRKPANTLADAG